jgi:hypothetical protein
MRVLRIIFFPENPDRNIREAGSQGFGIFARVADGFFPKNTGGSILKKCCICLTGFLEPCLPETTLGQQAAWKPERNVEIIVGTPPGAAPDKTARLIQKLWQAQRIYEGAHCPWSTSPVGVI